MSRTRSKVINLQVQALDKNTDAKDLFIFLKNCGFTFGDILRISHSLQGYAKRELTRRTKCKKN